MDKVVINKSSGYGYKYASLADIIQQGHEIPPMKTGLVDGKEYCFYWHKDSSSWVQAAQVVIPEMKSSNAAQKYGAALSYARRYSALLALGLASDDEDKIEKHFDLDETIKAIQTATSVEELNLLYQGTPQELRVKVLPHCKARKAEIGES